MSERRSAFVQAVRILHTPVAVACRHFGVSRQTGYVWLKRFDADPGVPLVDRSRRPTRSPDKTADDIEAAVLKLRDQHHWGARKIRVVLRNQGLLVPSIRTVHAILQRHGRVRRDPPPQETFIRFERSEPNDLWQADFLLNLEVARAFHSQLTILDDHSRYLLAMPLVKDRTMRTVWYVLWNLFGEVGMPNCLLSDNSFGSYHSSPRTISWLEARLLRLGIRSSHGRPYHPQTQGKVERVHGTIRTEFHAFARRDTLEHYTADSLEWRRLYNSARPHESLDDLPPLSRWRPSPRTRPASLPEVVYPHGSDLRRVCDRGLVRWKKSRILAGYGLAGEIVRVEEHDHEIRVFFASELARCIPTASLVADKIL